MEGVPRGNAILVVSIAIVFCLVVVIALRPPPAIRFARNVSHLNVPRSARVSLYRREDGSFTGDGNALAIVVLDSSQFDRLLREAAFKEYQPIPQQGMSTIVSVTGLPDAMAGAYWMKQRTEGRLDLAVLDSSRYALFVHSTW